MNRVFISDRGDDRNDGRTRETAVYSWDRAVKLCDENAEIRLMQSEPNLQRLHKEIKRREAKSDVGAQET